MIEPYVRLYFLDYVVEFHITIRGTETFFFTSISTKLPGPNNQ